MKHAKRTHSRQNHAMHDVFRISQEKLAQLLVVGLAEVDTPHTITFRSRCGCSNRTNYSQTSPPRPCRASRGLPATSQIERACRQHNVKRQLEEQQG